MLIAVYIHAVHAHSCKIGSYSLIKMMYWISKTTGERLTMNQLRHCLKRNFGGKPDVEEVVKRFLKDVTANMIDSEQHHGDVEVHVCVERICRSNCMNYCLEL